MIYTQYTDCFLQQAILPQQKAQLDKGEREHLKDIVTEMQERTDNNVELLQQIVCKDMP